MAFYNEQVEALNGGADAVAHAPSQFQWDGTAEQRAKRGLLAETQPSRFRSAIYRPFFRQHLYMDRVLNNSVYQIPTFFPAPDIRNPTIFVERGLRAPGRAPAALAVDVIPDIAAGAGASGLACQALPRYTYDEPSDGQQGVLVPDEPSRRDNITDEALGAYRAHYGDWVTKNHIFSYVYGILHSPDYRQHYANDLAKLLPRIPEVATAEAFHAFSEAGQRLLDLHIGYEEATPYPLEERHVPGRSRWAGALPSAKDALGNIN